VLVKQGVEDRRRKSDPGTKAIGKFGVEAVSVQLKEKRLILMPGQ
jgi:hypothetical protein